MQPTLRVTRRLVFVQALLGIGAQLAMALPFLRQVHGLKWLKPGQRYLFVANHTSLLDTILLGAVCWRSGNYPILTLGDKNVWNASWIKRLLSRRIGFLVERGKLNPNCVRELQFFGRQSNILNLVVFPEGTRGDGINVAECQPGIYFIAQEACVPIVPVFIENMHLVSTKHGGFHPVAGFRKVEVHFGEPIPPEKHLAMPREEFLKFIREEIAAAKPLPTAARLNPVLHRA